MMDNIDDINFNRSIKFKGEIDRKKIEVKISEDFSKVVVGNFNESYMLTAIDQWK
jgi:hypothetical protein